MSNKILLVAVGDCVSTDKGGHLYADIYKVGMENQLYLNGVYVAWYGQEWPCSMTYEAFCDLIDGLKMALPDVEVEEKQIKFGEEFAHEGWTWEKAEKLLNINQPQTKRIGRVVFDISYTVDLDDIEMVDHAKEAIIEDLTELVVRLGYADALESIKVQHSPCLTEADISDFLKDGKEEEEEDDGTA